MFTYGIAKLHRPTLPKLKRIDLVSTPATKQNGIAQSAFSRAKQNTPQDNRE
ncbi:hypothetical protein [Mucilaginibacter sp. UR6-11]|uniref:hypothetical protein n=1 Tax=Mucilaginibacter sp. UR6-11 TaxID=1435644 RepID=UPI001E4762F1|nr:hypothetical protein [Mucilaginibacter sp. UR6-11]MCC8426293.1 hypothetical protein [Mucilaginibacter sp. UR6-11]